MTLIDSFDEEFIRQFLRDNQADEERVEFITEVSQIDVIVDIIFTDCSDLFKLLSFNITSVIEARRRFLARGGLIIPDEHYLYLYGLWDEGLLRDTEQEWRFPFKNIDYTFLSNEVRIVASFPIIYFNEFFFQIVPQGDEVHYCAAEECCHPESLTTSVQPPQPKLGEVPLLPSPFPTGAP